jgi:3-oxoacyl-[acyl-carrier protein] reductase
MANRIILITGANGGLGRAVVCAFLEESASNFLCMGFHKRRDHVDRIASSFPGRCCCQPLDVTSPNSWKEAMNELIAHHGRVDVLVNNAGGQADALLATMSTNSWEKVMATNLNGVFHGCQAVLPTMISQRSGRIINVASLSALLVPAGQANYAAAKAGVVALTQSLAKEVARIGITVNVVCPGYIETEALASMDEAARKTAQSRVPMRRFGRPEEVAAAIRFLACAEASYITGSTLKIDGGIL